MTTQRMTQILLEVANGVSAPTDEKAEDARVRTQLTREVRQIKARGQIVDVPPELP